MERTHEEALHAGRESGHSEAAFAGEGTPLTLDDARRLVEGYVDHYNNVLLNSAVGYITPKDMLAGRQQEIQPRGTGSWEARKQRQIRRQTG